MIMCAITCQICGSTVELFIHTPALFWSQALQCKHSNVLQNTSVFAKHVSSPDFFYRVLLKRGLDVGGGGGFEQRQLHLVLPHFFNILSDGLWLRSETVELYLLD